MPPGTEDASDRLLKIHSPTSENIIYERPTTDRAAAEIYNIGVIMVFISIAPIFVTLNRSTCRAAGIIILLVSSLLLGCVVKKIKIPYLGYSFWNRCSVPLEIATINFSNGLTSDLSIEKPGWVSHAAVGAPVPESMDVVWKIQGGPERRQTILIKSKVTNLSRLRGFVVFFKDDRIEIFESLQASDDRDGTNKIN